MIELAPHTSCATATPCDDTSTGANSVGVGILPILIMAVIIVGVAVWMSRKDR